MSIYTFSLYFLFILTELSFSTPITSLSASESSSTCSYSSSERSALRILDLVNSPFLFQQDINVNFTTPLPSHSQDAEKKGADTPKRAAHLRRPFLTVGYAQTVDGSM